MPAPALVTSKEEDPFYAWYYYSNKDTGVSRWTPPPPPGAVCQDGGKASSDDDRKRESVASMMSFVVKVPKPSSYDKEINGEVVREEVKATNPEEPQKELTVHELTFTGMKPTKLYMNPKEGQESFPEKARALGIDPKGLTRQQLTKAVRDYWIRQHGDDVQSYQRSRCFVGEYVVYLIFLCISLDTLCSHVFFQSLHV